MHDSYRYPGIKFDPFAVEFRCPRCEGTCNCDQCCAKDGQKYVPMPRPRNVGNGKPLGHHHNSHQLKDLFCARMPAISAPIPSPPSVVRTSTASVHLVQRADLCTTAYDFCTISGSSFSSENQYGFGTPGADSYLELGSSFDSSEDFGPADEFMKEFISFPSSD